MKTFKSFFLVVAFVLAAMLTFVTCGKKSPIQNETQDNPPKSESTLEATTFAVPDSVPTVVDEAALSRAFELKCSGIRILQVVEDNSYHVVEDNS